MQQISPQDLPKPTRLFPAPWTATEAGNGHYYVQDKDGHMVAHVYCWDIPEQHILHKKMEEANENKQMVES